MKYKGKKARDWAAESNVVTPTSSDEHCTFKGKNKVFKKEKAGTASSASPPSASTVPIQLTVASEVEPHLHSSFENSKSPSKMCPFSRVELVLNLFAKKSTRTAVTGRDVRQLLQWSVPSPVPLVQAPEVFLLRNRSAVHHVLYIYLEGWSYDLLSGASIPPEDELQKMSTESGLSEAVMRNEERSSEYWSSEKSKNDRRARLLSIALLRLQRKLSLDMLGDIRRSRCWAREIALHDSLTSSSELVCSSIQEKSSRTAVQCAPLVVPGYQGSLEKEIFWTSSSTERVTSGAHEKICPLSDTLKRSTISESPSSDVVFPHLSPSKKAVNSPGVHNHFKVAMEIHLSSFGERQKLDRPSQEEGLSSPSTPSSTWPSSCNEGTNDGVCHTENEKKKTIKEATFHDHSKENSSEKNGEKKGQTENDGNHSNNDNPEDLVKLNATYWNNAALLSKYSIRYPDHINELLKLGFVVFPPDSNVTEVHTSFNQEKKDSEAMNSHKGRNKADKERLAFNNDRSNTNCSVFNENDGQLNTSCDSSNTRSPSSDTHGSWRWFPDPLRTTTKLDDYANEKEEKKNVSLVSSKPEDEKSLPNVVALDCEMVLVEGYVSALARATLVDACTGDVLVDMLVKPAKPVVNYVTRYSGITESMLKTVSNTLEDCQNALFQFIHSNSFLVGHSLENDLKACQLLPNCNILDSVHLFPHPAGLPMKNSLRFLVHRYFGLHIQDGAHDSTEDAWCSAQLVLLKLKNGPFFGIPQRKSVLCSMASACVARQTNSVAVNSVHPNAGEEDIDGLHSTKDVLEKREHARSTSLGNSSFSHWWGHFTLIDSPAGMKDLMPVSSDTPGLGALNTISTRNDDDAVRKGVKTLQNASLRCLIPSITTPSSFVPLPPPDTCSASAKVKEKVSSDSLKHCPPAQKLDSEYSTKAEKESENLLPHHKEDKHYHFCWVHLTQNVNPFLLLPPTTTLAHTKRKVGEREVPKEIPLNNSVDEEEREREEVDDQVWLRRELEAYECTWRDAIEKTNDRVLKLVEACPDDTVILLMSGGEHVYQPPPTQSEAHAGFSFSPLNAIQRSGSSVSQPLPPISGFRGAIFSFVKEKSAPGPLQKSPSNSYASKLASRDGLCIPKNNLNDSNIKESNNLMPDPPACQPQ